VFGGLDIPAAKGRRPKESRSCLALSLGGAEVGIFEGVG
jgi:hypothetical protein